MSPSAVSPGTIRVHKKMTRSGVCQGWVCTRGYITSKSLVFSRKGFVKLTGAEMNLLQYTGQGKTGDEEQMSLPVDWSETGDK